MNRFRTHFALVFLASLVPATLVGCGSTVSGTEGNISGGRGAPSNVGGPGDGDGDGDVAPQAGLLTAGAWDDNRNFSFFQDYVSAVSQTGVPQISPSDRTDAWIDFGGDRPSKSVLDIAIVLDTTTSMGDELAYLKAEIVGLAVDIEELFPDADQRWAFVTYRDYPDEGYLTNARDFTSDVTDLAEWLDEESLFGGGEDWPEALAPALEDLVALNWRTGDGVAKLAFVFTDAPHHQEDTARVTSSFIEARAIGLHLYPVIGSGGTTRAESSMRVGAQVTGGRYLFLTDDSGVGAAHAEPTIPCYFVTLLRDAILRIVEMELTGLYLEPSADQVIRTQGDPESGACELQDGTQVQAF